jgi:type I restriction enzyme M protein
VSDPACGTGGFLLSAYDYVVRHQGRDLDPDEKKHLKRGFARGWELVPNTARLCIMNLMLHGIDADPCPIVSGKDSLASPPGDKDRASLVLTNPPFGKKSTMAIVNEEGELEKEDEAYERPDFWTSTKNKQLNFLQHVKSLLSVNGRARSWFLTTCFSREARARPCGGSCSNNATSTPCFASRPASSTLKA